MKRWLKWSLFIWLIVFVLIWLGFITQGLIESIGKGRPISFDCFAGLAGTNSCSFFEFVFHPIHWIVILVYSLPSILIGALIGWIVGKIKKKPNQQPH